MSENNKLSGPKQVFGTDFNSRSTTAKEKVGTRALDEDGNEYVYVKAGGSILAGSPIDLQLGLSAVAASAGAKGFGAIATAAFSANDYGFALSRGRGLAIVPSGIAVGDPLTAGTAALSTTMTSAVRFVTAQEAAPTLSGTTQTKYVWLH